jgi:hypothetical protein
LKKENVELRGDDNGLAIHIAIGLLKSRETLSASSVNTQTKA